MARPACLQRPPGTFPPENVACYFLFRSILRMSLLFLIFCPVSDYYLQWNEEFARMVGGGGTPAVDPPINAPMKKHWTTKLIHSDARVLAGPELLP